MKKILQSPFLHFMCIGAAIFVLYSWLNRDANHPEGFDIHISEDHQIQIALAHERNFGTLPDATTMDRLVAAEVKSEIYYREALRLGLDEDDEIIRRRLKQKYEFINKDNTLINTPTDTELRAFYAEYKDRYMAPSKFSFDHYYFSPDRHSDPRKSAEAYVQNTSLLSDPFHIASPKMNQTIEELRNEFGITFADGLVEQRETSDLIILESGFGYHVVKIRDVVSAQALGYASIRQELVEDYKTFVLSERNMQNYEELKKEYAIVVEALN